MHLPAEDIEIQNGGRLRLLEYPNEPVSVWDTSIFTPEETKRFNTFKSTKRQAEYYYTRKLWLSFEHPEKISYDPLDRPTLNQGFISISHSRDLILIGYHPTHAIGVDVEYQSPKISAIAHKFISAADFEKMNSQTEIDLTLIWSIKEAVFKMERIEGLLFKENIHVTLKESLAQVTVLKGNEYHLYEFGYQVRDGFVLTWCSHADFNGKFLF